MLELLSKIDRLDITEYDFTLGNRFKVHLSAPERKVDNTVHYSLEEGLTQGRNYRITVKKYMTEPATVTFDFQDKWNDGKPMPMMTMEGEVLQETRGMYKMKLHAIINDISKPVERCYNCGRALTHPVSRLYGIGPECGKHMYINPYESIEELKEHLNELHARLEEIQWEGWVIKSAIKEWEEI